MDEEDGNSPEEKTSQVVYPVFGGIPADKFPPEVQRKLAQAMVDALWGRISTEEFFRIQEEAKKGLKASEN